MNLENGIKDVIYQKMQDGTIEKLIQEQLEKGVLNALDKMFGPYGDVTKVIEAQIKSVMIPYLEGYDYSKYITKLDSVLVEVLENCATDNKELLQNFQQLMLPEQPKTISASGLFKSWCGYVAKEVETDGLDVCYEDSISYEPVEVSLSVNYDDSPSWSSFKHATLIFECEHDENMNFAIRLSRFQKSSKDEWVVHCRSVQDISSIRYLNEFDILLMRLNQVGVKLILDTDFEYDEITPEKEPEARYE